MTLEFVNEMQNRLDVAKNENEVYLVLEFFKTECINDLMYRFDLLNCKNKKEAAKSLYSCVWKDLIDSNAFAHGNIKFKVLYFHLRDEIVKFETIFKAGWF